VAEICLEDVSRGRGEGAGRKAGARSASLARSRSRSAGAGERSRLSSPSAPTSRPSATSATRSSCSASARQVVAGLVSTGRPRWERRAVSPDFPERWSSRSRPSSSRASLKRSVFARGGSRARPRARHREVRSAHDRPHLVLHGEVVCKEAGLVLPAPEILERPFRPPCPCSELEPKLVLPGADRPPATLARGLSSSRWRRRSCSTLACAG